MPKPDCMGVLDQGRDKALADIKEKNQSVPEPLDANYVYESSLWLVLRSILRGFKEIKAQICFKLDSLLVIFNLKLTVKASDPSK